MKSASFIRRLAFFLPLLAPFIFIVQPDKPLPSELFLALALGYARIAAFVRGYRGWEEIILGAMALPFGTAGAGYYGALGGAGLLVLGAQALLAFVALVLLETLLLPKYPGFALPLGFLFFLSMSLVAASFLPPTLLFGAESLIIGLTAYIRARRSR